MAKKPEHTMAIVTASRAVKAIIDAQLGASTGPDPLDAAPAQPPNPPPAPKQGHRP
jgi:hypothetical protein